MLIRHATVLTFDPAIGDLDDADVLVDGDRIAAVGADLRADGHDEIDASGCLVIPGFVDTHRHMWEGSLRGLVGADTLHGYFDRVLTGIAPALTPEDLGVAEALSARSALAAGITTVLDFSDINGDPARTDAIVAALQDSGLRARFSYGLAQEWSQHHGGALPDDVRRVRTTLLHDDHALVTMGLAPVVADDDAERHNAAIADELGLRVAYHVRPDVPPSRLLRLDALRANTTFIHGNGLGHDDLALIADHGGTLSISPVVEMALGLGNPMITEALQVPGLELSLSCDVDITGPSDMFTQMRTLYLVARAASTASPLTLRAVLGYATLDGARALGLDHIIGSITPGKQADLLILRADDATAAPVIDPYSTVVLQMDRSHIDTVLVAGVTHKRAGRAVCDDDTLLSAARITLGRLRDAGALAAQSNSEVSDPVEAAMVAANSLSGPRAVAGRSIPAPQTVSPAMRAAIEAPYRSPAWNLRPADSQEWRQKSAQLADSILAQLPALREQFGVTTEPTNIGGVPGYSVRPTAAPIGSPRLLHVHGGGYVYNAGEAGTLEAIVMAGIAGIEVFSVDYRLAYDAPYPAALDDVVAAWRGWLGSRPAAQLGVFGTSAGAALTLSLVLRARRERLALPAAIGLGSPWSDLTETGDSYRTNEWLDNVEVSYRGFLSGAADLYAAGHDLRDPMLSPVYGDFSGAPPAILVAGTRDLFLSNTIRVHRAMRAARVDAQLHVFEGQSHAQYLFALDSPETREMYTEIAAHLTARTAA